MFRFLNIFLVNIFFLVFVFIQFSFSEEKNIYDILEIIQKDIKTLERAVYSAENNNDSDDSIVEFNQNSEDVLTRHLLKLNEIENQFQKLTNSFEEINFKLDKLSTRLSKVQADNQIRFQQLEDQTITKSEINQYDSNKLSLKTKKNEDKILPGSSKPQDLGTLSYKDTATNELTQQTQSVDTTSAVVAEIFESEEKLLPNVNPEKQYEFATSFLKVGDYTTAERAFREFVITNPRT